MGPPYETLIFTLRSNFKFCFQFVLTSYLPQNIHEKYTLALKGECSPSHLTWHTGARDRGKQKQAVQWGWIDWPKVAQQCLRVALSLQGYRTWSDYFELDLVKCCWNTNLFGRLSPEQMMEISFFADMKLLCFGLEAQQPEQQGGQQVSRVHQSARLSHQH